MAPFLKRIDLLEFVKDDRFEFEDEEEAYSSENKKSSLVGHTDGRDSHRVST